jgi:hypothetical protein
LVCFSYVFAYHLRWFQVEVISKYRKIK